MPRPVPRVIVAVVGYLAATPRLSLSARLSKYTFILKFVSRWALILFFFDINCTQRQHHYCRLYFCMSCSANEHQHYHPDKRHQQSNYFRIIPNKVACS